MSTYQLQIQEHKRKLLADDQHQASLEGKFSPTIETPIVDSQLEGIAWDEESHLCSFWPDCDDNCDCTGRCYPKCDKCLSTQLSDDGQDCECGYEPGRSEADKRYHEENCGVCSQCGERDTDCACNRFVRAL